MWTVSLLDAISVGSILSASNHLNLEVLEDVGKWGENHRKNGQLQENRFSWNHAALLVISEVNLWNEFEVADHVCVLHRVSKTDENEINLEKGEDDIFETVHVRPVAKLMSNDGDDFQSALLVCVKEFILLVWFRLLWLSIFVKLWLLFFLLLDFGV